MVSEAGRVRCVRAAQAAGRKVRFEAPNGGEFMLMPSHAGHAVHLRRVVPGDVCSSHDGICRRGVTS